MLNGESTYIGLDKKKDDVVLYNQKLEGSASTGLMRSNHGVVV